MNAAEIAAKLAAYRDALAIVKQHAQLCGEAASLELDISTSLQGRVAALEAQAAQGKRGKGNG